MRLLVKNIGKIVGIETAGRLRLCGGEMDRLETLDDAWLLADDGRIAAFGRMETLGEMAADRTVDAEGGMLFPSFCDSHTHLVYAGSREREFLDKINGLSYEEIARRGGGILNSADPAARNFGRGALRAGDGARARDRPRRERAASRSRAAMV